MTLPEKIDSMKYILEASECKKVNLLGNIAEENDKAREIYGPFNSTHEVYGVLKEELDEFWQLVKMQPGRHKSEQMVRELTQIAAVAIRAITEIEEIKHI